MQAGVGKRGGEREMRVSSRCHKKLRDCKGGLQELILRALCFAGAVLRLVEGESS